MSVDFLDLSIRELSRNFGRRRALTRVSLDCRSGEIVGLLGPNGAGKSTLLSILSTLAVPSSGDVLYGGRTAKAIGAEVRSRIGVLSHDLHLYSELTALENLIFFGRLYGVPGADTVAAEALRRARLDDRAGDLVSGFSRGMRQRLALERALLHNPRLLLLDEPFTGLDDASTMALIARLRELRSAGCIMLVATHDLDVGEAVLDRAVILHDGRLIASEPDVRGLRKRYQDRLQAGAPA
ncbi:MAG TPA: ABC transporter ATP-binding protein [Vicinamibacterales bacterium]|nr:ABC transporter ATP-binding protein [Vicinamibacterales bacterium]